MAEALESWEWRDPAEVAARRELQANAAAARESARLIERAAKQTEQERIKALVFKGRK